MGSNTSFKVDCSIKPNWIEFIKSLYDKDIKFNKWTYAIEKHKDKMDNKELKIFNEFANLKRATMIPFGYNFSYSQFKKFEKEGIVEVDSECRWRFTCCFKNYNSEIKIFSLKILPIISNKIYQCIDFCEDMEDEGYDYIKKQYFKITDSMLEELL
jgi:hypothetical protein